MFVVEAAPPSLTEITSPSVEVGTRYLIDHDRNVWCRPVVNHLTEPGWTFELRLVGRSIPFDVQGRRDPESGLDVRTVSALGGSSLARLLGGLDPVFLTEGERERAKLLVAEALIAFGSWFDGWGPSSSGFGVTFAEDARVFTAGDFENDEKVRER